LTFGLVWNIGARVCVPFANNNVVQSLWGIWWGLVWELASNGVPFSQLPCPAFARNALPGIFWVVFRDSESHFVFLYRGNENPIFRVDTNPSKGTFARLLGFDIGHLMWIFWLVWVELNRFT
jgi:hypothetical protein